MKDYSAKEKTMPINDAMNEKIMRLPDNQHWNEKLRYILGRNGALRSNENCLVCSDFEFDEDLHEKECIKVYYLPHKSKNSRSKKEYRRKCLAMSTSEKSSFFILQSNNRETCHYSFFKRYIEKRNQDFNQAKEWNPDTRQTLARKFNKQMGKFIDQPWGEKNYNKKAIQQWAKDIGVSEKELVFWSGKTFRVTAATDGINCGLTSNQSQMQGNWSNHQMVHQYAKNTPSLKLNIAHKISSQMNNSMGTTTVTEISISPFKSNAFVEHTEETTKPIPPLILKPGTKRPRVVDEEYVDEEEKYEEDLEDPPAKRVKKTVSFDCKICKTYYSDCTGKKRKCALCSKFCCVGCLVKSSLTNICVNCQ